MLVARQPIFPLGDDNCTRVSGGIACAPAATLSAPSASAAITMPRIARPLMSSASRL